MSEIEPPTERPMVYDESELYDVGPVTPQTYFWIFLMAFYVIATGIGLYLAMGNSYVTIPQGNWILR
jgi:Ni,Fe-hydrogenase I cytochrome b subunit